MDIRDEIVGLIDKESIRVRNLWKSRIHSRDIEIERLENICKRNGIGWKKPATKKSPRKSVSI